MCPNSIYFGPEVPKYGLHYGQSSKYILLEHMDPQGLIVHEVFGLDTNTPAELFKAMHSNVSYTQPQTVLGQGV